MGLRRFLLAVVGAVSLAAPALSAGAAGPALQLLANTPKAGTIHSDLAFWGRIAYEGNYDGFRVIDISKPNSPVVLADIHCRGPQNDISVWSHLVFLSVD